MLISKKHILAIAVASILFNASCSSDSDSGEMQNGDTGDTTENTDNSGADNTDTDNTDTDNTDTDNTDTDNTDTDNAGTDNQAGEAGAFGPAQFVIADCGSIEVSSAQASNDVATPTALLTSQLVQGQLAEESTVLNSDIWQITLQPGNYHLFVDSWLASEERGVHGVRITSLGATSNEDERIFNGPSSSFNERGYEYLEILNPTTMTMKVEPIYDGTMNYVMGIIPNGSAVPSPRFTNCPPLTQISLNETNAVTLPELNSADDYRWYQVNLNAGVYTLDASTQSADSPVGYRVELLQRFGDDDNSERAVSQTAAATSLTSSDQFTALDNADVWLRVESVYDDAANFEFTISQ